MSRFSEWLSEKYTIWEKTQGKKETYMSYAAYLGVDPSAMISMMMEKALPDSGDLMAIAAKEGTEVYDLLAEEHPDEGVIEIFSSLGQMPTDLRMRMAHAIFEAEQAVKRKDIPFESEEAKQVYIDALERWGFRFSGEIKVRK